MRALWLISYTLFLFAFFTGLILSRAFNTVRKNPKVRQMVLVISFKFIVLNLIFENHSVKTLHIVLIYKKKEY